MVSAPINDCKRIGQHMSNSTTHVEDIRVLESYQNRVFREITANLSGITSTEKYAPRSKTWPASDGIKCFQMLFQTKLKI